MTAIDLLAIIFYFWLRFSQDAWVMYGFFKKTIPIGYIDVIIFYYGLVIGYSIYRYWLSLKSPEFPEGYLYPDYPIEKMATKYKTPIGKQDLLNRNKFAQQIANSIRKIEPFHSFAIGISGPWGSGKTSLISLIIDNLKKKDGINPLNNKDFEFIEFSPWFFSNSEILITSFFSILEKKFSDNKILVNELKAYLSEITTIEKTVFTTEFLKILEGKETKTLKSRYDNIAKAIISQNKTLVVTIDDIDRLDKKEIVDTFRLIRVIADFPKTFYIVGYDREYVNSAIEDELTKHNPDKYIDKIFNLEFKIPAVDSDGLNFRLKRALETQLRKLDDSVAQVPQEELAMCFHDNYSINIVCNERDIKKFVNNLLLRFLAIQDDVNFFHLYILELIYYKNVAIYSNLFLEKDRLFKLHNNTGLILDEKYEELIFKNRTLDNDCLKLIKLLFKHEYEFKHIPKGINHIQYFLRYFSLSLLTSEFSKKEFDESLKKPAEIMAIDLNELNSRNGTLLIEHLGNLMFSDNLTSGTEEDLERQIVGLSLFFRDIASQTEKATTTQILGTIVLIVKDFALVKSSLLSLKALIDKHCIKTPIDLFYYTMLFKNANIYAGFNEREDSFKIRILTEIRDILFSFYSRAITDSLETWRIMFIVNGVSEIVLQISGLQFKRGLREPDNETNQFTWFERKVIVPYVSQLNDMAKEINQYFKDTIGDFYSGMPSEIYFNHFNKVDAKKMRQHGLIQLSGLDKGIFFKDQTSVTFKSDELVEYNDTLHTRIFSLEKSVYVIEIEPKINTFWRFGI
ncbi:MAG: KAP family NTPase, partial [Chitinophagaceae bacterium]|nr:KAP family NTPase [Chitinophagaceae bacterium]